MQLPVVNYPWSTTRLTNMLLIQETSGRVVPGIALPGTPLLPYPGYTPPTRTLTSSKHALRLTFWTSPRELAAYGSQNVHTVPNHARWNVIGKDMLHPGTRKSRKIGYARLLTGPCQAGYTQIRVSQRSVIGVPEVRYRCPRCQMSDVRCQMSVSDVRCQMSDVRCQDLRCPTGDVPRVMSHGVQFDPIYGILNEQ